MNFLPVAGEVTYKFTQTQMTEYAKSLCLQVIQAKPMLFLGIAVVTELIELLIRLFIKENIILIKQGSYTLDLHRVVDYLGFLRLVGLFTAFMYIWLGTKIL